MQHDPHVCRGRKEFDVVFKRKGRIDEAQLEHSSERPHEEKEEEKHRGRKQPARILTASAIGFRCKRATHHAAPIASIDG